jgi:AraC-like DNA-binding protein
MLKILPNTIADLPAGSELWVGQQLSLPVQIEGKVGRLVVSVHGFEELPPVPKTRRARQLASHQLKRACAAVQELYAEPVRLGAIASMVGLSPWQFSRSFHATAGVTFSCYVMQVRIDAAMRLMLETDKSLCEIALASGFGDQSNFSRLFLRSLGVTPMKWRRLNRHSSNGDTSVRRGLLVHSQSDIGQRLVVRDGPYQHYDRDEVAICATSA